MIALFVVHSLSVWRRADRADSPVQDLQVPGETSNRPPPTLPDADISRDSQEVVDGDSAVFQSAVFYERVASATSIVAGWSFCLIFILNFADCVRQVANPPPCGMTLVQGNVIPNSSKVDEYFRVQSLTEEMMNKNQVF